MVGSFAAEWLKLRKRPAVWVFAGVLVGAGGCSGLPPPVPGHRRLAAQPGAGRLARRAAAKPQHLVRMSLGTASGGVGSAVALILGVLAVGGEYGWSTLKSVLTQRPGRVSGFLGKAAALAPCSSSSTSSCTDVRHRGCLRRAGWRLLQRGQPLAGRPGRSQGAAGRLADHGGLGCARAALAELFRQLTLHSEARAATDRQGPALTALPDASIPNIAGARCNAARAGVGPLGDIPASQMLQSLT